MAVEGGAGGKDLEGRLFASEERLSAFLQASPMGIHLYRLEPGERLIFAGANPAADRILGIDHQPLVGRPIEEAFPNLAGTEIPDRFRAVCLTGEPWETGEVNYEDERVRGVFEVHAFRIGPDAMAALFLEISARKRDERRLRDSEEKYRLLVENAGDGIFIAQDGKVMFSNRRAAQMVGYPTAAEVTNRSFLDFIAPEDWDLVKDRYRRRMAGEEVPSTYELRLRLPDGTTFWTQLNAVLTTWEGRPATLNFIRDVDAIKRMESQLFFAERMQSIGTLAGGVAHDFNNILMGIQGNVSLLLLNLDPTHPSCERLRNIERAIESGAKLTSQILGFARAGKYQVEPTDLNALLAASVLLFGRAKKEIALRTSYQKDLWTVEVDRAQIEQVFVNLLVNAWQSMPGGGEIFVESRNVALPGETVSGDVLKAGRYVSIAVRDTGSGIDPALQNRIFDPFFTTRERGRGTGLGLASAYGVVRNHGGAIRLQSALGSGSTFTVLLPASDKPLTAPTLAPGEKSELERGTVLVVEDEAPVLAVTIALLRGLGYAVLSAGSGREAIELFRAHRGGIDAVILDMVMPGMGGGETFDRLREIDPAVRVLLSSGYSLDNQARAILERGCGGFIQKPYDIGTLSRKLRDLIERR